MNFDCVNAEYEYEIKTKLTDEEVKKEIQKVLNIEDLNEIINYNTKIRNEKIKKLKIIKGTSVNQLARVIGIKRQTVDRAMKG